MARENEGLAHALTIAIAVAGLACSLVAGVHAALVTVVVITLFSFKLRRVGMRENQAQQILLILTVMFSLVAAVACGGWWLILQLRGL